MGGGLAQGVAGEQQHTGHLGCRGLLLFHGKQVGSALDIAGPRMDRVQRDADRLIPEEGATNRRWASCMAVGEVPASAQRRLFSAVPLINCGCGYPWRVSVSPGWKLGAVSSTGCYYWLHV